MKESESTPWGEYISAVHKEWLLNNISCIVDHFKAFGFYYEWDGNRVEDFREWLAWSDLYFHNVLLAFGLDIDKMEHM